MVFLTPVQDLYDLSQNVKCIGFDNDFQCGKFAITTETSIALLQAKDNKVLKVWTCRRGQKNTSTALYASKEGEYVTVLNEKILKMYKDDSNEISQTFTVKGKIHTLVKCHSMNPLIVLCDGTLYHLQQALQDPTTIVSDRNIDFNVEKFLFTTSFPHEVNSVMVCSICYINQKCTFLISVIEKSEKAKAENFRVVPKLETEIKAASSFSASKTPMIVTVLSNGMICLDKVIKNHSGVEVVVAPIIKLEIDDNVSLTSISHDQVAVLSKGPSLVIVDLKFGSVISKIPVHGPVLQIYSFDNMIILEKPGLLQKIVHDTQAVTLANVALNHNRDFPQLNFQSGKWPSPSYQRFLLNTKELDAFNTFVETKQEKIFHQLWKSLWVDKSLEFKREFCSSDMMRQILAKFGVNKHDRPMWIRSIISEIVETGLINGSWCQGIMQCCLEESDCLLLHGCLLHVNDIPECMIVSCLEHFIKHLDKDQILEGSESEVKVPENIRSCLSQVFLLPFSENALRKELVSMPFESAMVLVRYLTSVLRFSLISEQVCAEL